MNAPATYFVEKIGQYSHGIWWIGNDFPGARIACLNFAKADSDEYHQWVVKVFRYQYLDQACFDPIHEIVFCVRKQMAFDILEKINSGK